MLIGSIVGNYNVRYVFVAFTISVVTGGLITIAFAPETKGRVLEDLSP